MTHSLFAEPLYLENDRVILRPLAEADSDALRDLFDYPLDERRRMEMLKQLCQAKGNGTLVLAILDRDEKILRGILEVKVKGPASLEIGYRIKKPYRSRGYASQAVCLFSKAACDEYGNDEIHAFVKKDNEYSRRLLCRCGYEKTNENDRMEEYVFSAKGKDRQETVGNNNQED
ncbi:MAG: GNAT family N-acetyltransferase [Solobacterium sp.]|nr:GNAT family N-acetyltransferase [Solobacterium sp.]